MKYSKYDTLDRLWGKQVPSHWEIAPLCSIAREKSICNCSDLELLSVYLDVGVVPFVKMGTKRANATSKDTSKYQRVDPGDLVLNNQQAWRGSVGVSDYKGIVSPAYVILTLNDALSRKYANFLMRSAFMIDQFYVASKGVGSIQRNISWSDFKRSIVPIPPREEQDQIVRYLDWQLSKINKLIHGYQRQIKLLEEHKLTVINDAITKGLNPNVEFKNVDSNWTGCIPAHWNFGTVKQHFRIQKRIAGKEGYDVISITQQGLKVKDVASNEGQIAASYANYQFVYPGEFAMNHMDLLTGYVGLSDIFGVTSPDYRVFALEDIENCDPQYYLYIFQLGYKRRIFYGLGKGAASKGRWRMPAINFKNFGIPIPPIEEQRDIIQYIKEQENAINRLVEGIEKQIEFLKEYRTRLISDVVTGQMDVRGIEIPEYTPEEDTEDISDTEEAADEEVSENE